MFSTLQKIWQLELFFNHLHGYENELSWKKTNTFTEEYLD